MNSSARTLALEFESADALRGLDAYERKNWLAALEAFDRALASNPADTRLLNYQARVLDKLERWTDALQAIERALILDPSNPADLRNRALLLRKLERLPEALAAFEEVLKRRPYDSDILIKRIHLLKDLNRREDALLCSQELVAMSPEDLMALNARGSVFESLGQYEDAAADFARMLGLDPGNQDGMNNMGMVLARKGRWTEALGHYERSLALNPAQPQAFYNRSIVRLALGDWSRGLEEFECRWRLSPLRATRPPALAPLWNGRDSLTGKTVYVYHEQGYGDTLQCVRYVPELAKRGARVILGVPPALKELMRSVQGVERLVSSGDALPAHDLQCPLMSLLRGLGVTPDNVLYSAAYLAAPDRIVEQWHPRLGASRRLRIGLVWSGRRYAPINYPRDVPLEELAPLLGLDAEFICLQTEMAEADRTLLHSFPQLDCRWMSQLPDFSHTAALIETLDLVISADTAVAHLAGALGKPVWLLNRYASCWRWGQSGSSTAWYPTMRIFRQRTVGDWSGVAEEIKAALQVRIGAPAVPRQDVSFIPPPPPPIAETPSRLRLVVPGALAVEPEKIRFVCATRLSAEDFMKQSPLGRSLPFYRTFPRGQRIELRLFKNNTAGLPVVYNTAIEEARADPAILVFIHDDVYLNDYYWASHLRDGLEVFDVVGLAGNKRRAARQASWMYLNDRFTSDDYENLSGVIGHGEGFPELRQLSVYGEPGQECKLLDGVLLAVRSRTLIGTGLRFDSRFEFDFYDLDFCRQAEALDIKMGTWAISAIHASVGNLGCPRWRAAYEAYLAKYDGT